MKKIAMFLLLSWGFYSALSLAAVEPLRSTTSVPKPSATPGGAKQAFQQIPKEADFYYAIGGAAPIPPGLNYQTFSPIGEASIKPLSCGAFKTEDAMQQAILDTKVLLDKAWDARKIIQNHPLYLLGATDPRLFALLLNSVELAKDTINQKVVRCEAINQQASTNVSDAPFNSLLAMNQAREIAGLQQSQNIVTAINSAERLTQAPLFFPCPANPNQKCVGSVVSTNIVYAHKQLTEGMKPGNPYEEEFGTAEGAAQIVRDLIGDIHISNKDNKSSYASIPAKGLDYLYHVRVQENLSRLNTAIQNTKKALDNKQGASVEIVRYAAGGQTSGPVITADLLERLARDWKHTNEVVMRIAADKAFLQVNRQARLAMNLLNAALSLPSVQVNPLAQRLIEQGQQELKTAIEFFYRERGASQEMAHNLRTIVQKAEADDLRSVRQPTIRPKSNVCFVDGAFVEC